MRRSTIPVSRRKLLKLGGAGIALAGNAPFRAESQSASSLFQKVDDKVISTSGSLAFVKIDGNENPNGPSEKAVQAIQAAIAQSNRYVLTADRLQHAIARHHSVGFEMVQLGYGSSEILKMAAEAFLSPGKSVLVASPTYEGMARYGEVYGAKIERVPLDSRYRHDLTRMLALVNEETALIYICNPNNPTATIVGADEFRDFCSQVPAHIPVIVDEAYHHYVDDPSYGSAISLVLQNKALIVTRTFSKIYGMAGLRLGYGIARQDLISTMNQRKVWLNANTLALAAALACFDDQEFVTGNKKQNKETRQFVEAELKKLGFETIPSQANFLMVDLKRDMQPIQAALRARRVYVGRPFLPLSHHLRVTIGTRSEMEKFLKEFSEIMSQT